MDEKCIYIFYDDKQNYPIMKINVNTQDFPLIDFMLFPELNVSSYIYLLLKSMYSRCP